jgi:subtilisin family serine protease
MNRYQPAVFAAIALAVIACADENPSAPQSLLPDFSTRSEPAPLLEHRGARKLPGEYIVVLHDGADANAVAARHGKSPKHVYSAALNGFATALTMGELQRLRHDDAVRYVEEDGIAEIHQQMQAPTNMPDIGGPSTQVTQPTPATLWGLDKLDQDFGSGLSGNYNYTIYGNGVNVYVLDTGIRTTHNEFDGLIANRAKAGALGFDAMGGNGQDCNGHGTHIAGTIGGWTYGVAKKAKLYSVRVVDCNGAGPWSNVIAGIDWVTNKHVKPAVGVMALGGAGVVTAVVDAVNTSIDYGVTYVVSAGSSNSDACTFTPSGIVRAITVAATDNTNARHPASNWGACVDTNSPGIGVQSAWWTSDVASQIISGTSPAAAHVAGLATMYLEVVKNATPAQVTDVLADNYGAGTVTGLVGATPNVIAHANTGSLGGAGAAMQMPRSILGQFYYFSTNAGFHHVWLRGTPGTNYNIKFYQWNGAAWILKATKATASTNEYLVTSQPGGFFYQYTIESASGSGTFDSWVLRPN